MQRWALELGRSCECLSGQARVEKAGAAVFSVWIDSEEDSEKEGNEKRARMAPGLLKWPRSKYWQEFGE